MSETSLHQQEQTFQRTYQQSISAYGMALVWGARYTAKGYRWLEHDFCLFTFDIPAEITDQFALSVVLDDLLQSAKLYTTIRHPVRLSSSPYKIHTYDIWWNLPPSYRPLFDGQRKVAQDWTLELRGELPIPTDNPQCLRAYWLRLQILLHCWALGVPYGEGCEEFLPPYWKARVTTWPAQHRVYYLVDGKEVYYPPPPPLLRSTDFESVVEGFGSDVESV